MMKFEVGKEYLTRSGKICTVLDTNYNGNILIKCAYRGDRYGCYALDTNGRCECNQQLDIVGEKPKELHYKVYYVYSTSSQDPDRIVLWTTISESELNKVEEIKARLVASGRNFYGVYKVEFSSDGTNEKINF